LSGLDHAEITHRWRERRVQLDAARGKLVQREAVPPSQAAESGAEEVALAEKSGHVKLTV
jgi:hypothetical protein